MPPSVQLAQRLHHARQRVPPHRRQLRANVIVQIPDDAAQRVASQTDAEQLDAFSRVTLDVHLEPEGDQGHGQDDEHALVYQRVLERQVDDGEGDAVEQEEDGDHVVRSTHRLADLDEAIADGRRAVDHGDFVEELHAVVERGVEERRAHADDHEAEVADHEATLEVVANRLVNSHERRDQNPRVGQRVPELGHVIRRLQRTH